MNHTRPIPNGARENFRTLCDAANTDRICLLSVFDATVGEPATLVCAVNLYEGDDQPFELIPLAMMIGENAYSRFIPPFDNVETSHA